MKDQWEDDHAVLRAELAALQKKLQALEASQERPHTASGGSRQRLSRSALVLSIAFAALLPAGVIYGQKAMEALFIDKNGNVGVATSEPRATLDVNGTLAVAKKLSASDVDVQGTLNATKASNLTDATVSGSLTGPRTRLQVVGEKKAGSEALSLRNLSEGDDAHKGVYHSYYVGNRDGQGGNEMARILGANKDDGYLSNGYLSFYTRTADQVTEKVRIDSSSVNVKGALVLNGGLQVSPGAVGGDKLPVRMELKQNAAKNPPRNLGSIPLDPYCTDADGCRIRIRTETIATAIEFFMVTLDVAVSSGGKGNSDRQIHMKDQWGEARCQVTGKCGRSWLSNALKVNVVGPDNLAFDADGRMTVSVTVYDN